MAISGLSARVFPLVLLAAALHANEMSLQNNGRYGPVSDDPAVRLVEERLKVELGKTSSTVRVTSRFIHPGGRVKFSLLYPDLAQGWQAFQIEQTGLPPEKRVKWTDRDNPFYVFPYCPLTNTARLGGAFSGRLEEVETLVNGKPAAAQETSLRVAVSSDTTWAFLTKDQGFPMVWQTIAAETDEAGAVIVERTFRARNTTYLGGAEVNFFDYEVLAGRGASPDTFSVMLHLRDGLTVDHLKWQGLNQTDTRHTMPARERWTVLDERTLRLFWSQPFRDPGKNLIRLAWDHEWVNAPPGGPPVHTNAVRFLRFLETPKGAPPALEVSREYFAQNFRVVIYPTAVLTNKDRKALRLRKIKPGAALEVQGIRTAPDEISVRDGAIFKIK